MDSASLVDHFHRYFELQLASTEELLAEAQRLRYRVYCEEFGYEDKANFPDGREKDAFDEIAHHALIRHQTSGKIVSCVRLIPGDAATSLPFEINCTGSYDPRALAPMSRSTFCEISRLTVDPMFRRRPGETASQFGSSKMTGLTLEERRLLPFIGISTLLAGTSLTLLTGRRNIFAMMETFLPELLTGIGIHFQKIGRTISYHGKRALYHTRTESVCLLMKPELKDLFLSLHAELKPHFPSAETPADPLVDSSLSRRSMTAS